MTSGFLKVVLVCTVVLFTCTGCLATRSFNPPLAELKKTISLEKRHSLSANDDYGMGLSPSFLEEAKISTGILINGPCTVVCSTRKLKNNAIRYSITVIGISDCRVGSAVPVAKDGYFLTAKHCIGEKLTLICIDRDRIMQQKPVRIVWRNSERDSKADLALVKADLEPYKSFPFFRGKISTTTVPRLFVFGWSNFADFGRESGEAAGVLISAKHQQVSEGGNDWIVSRHTAPLATGDSGGPVFNDSGNLVGINQKVYFSWSSYLITLLGINVKSTSPYFSYFAQSILPDETWLGALLDLDRGQHHESPKPAVTHVSQMSTHQITFTVPALHLRCN